MINLNKKKTVLMVISTLLVIIFGYLILDYRLGLLIFRNNQSQELTTEEIHNISESIGAIRCENMDSKNESVKFLSDIYGSAVYITLDRGLTKGARVQKTGISLLITNEHVAQNSSYYLESESRMYQYCYVNFNSNEYNESISFRYLPKTSFGNELFDISLLWPVDEKMFSEGTIITRYQQQYINDLPIADIDIAPLNNNGEAYKICDPIEVGTKIYVFGYPSSGDTEMPPVLIKDIPDKNYDNSSSNFNKSRNLVVTEGIVSGFQENNYLTTAQIDTGNSGGLAVSKKDGKICLIGIPTWVSIGDIQALGVIQPFSKIYDAGIDWSVIPTPE